MSDPGNVQRARIEERLPTGSRRPHAACQHRQHRVTAAGGRSLNK